MLNLTNYNIRRRYLEEKARARIMGEEPYTYAKMAKQFDTDDRTVYTWITRVKKLQHLPVNAAKRAKLSAWVNEMGSNGGVK